MKADSRFLDLIERIQGGHLMTREECAYLIGFGETSLEAAIMRGVADTMSRAKFGNKGLVFGQIGVDVMPCSGRCRFCSFSEEFTKFEKEGGILTRNGEVMCSIEGRFGFTVSDAGCPDKNMQITEGTFRIPEAQYCDLRTIK